MNLICRGAPYESNPPKLERVNTRITAKYRNVPYSVHPPQSPRILNALVGWAK